MLLDSCSVLIALVGSTIGAARENETHTGLPRHHYHLLLDAQHAVQAYILWRQPSLPTLYFGSGQTLDSAARKANIGDLDT